MKNQRDKPRKRDEFGRFCSGRNGQPIPNGRKFKAEDGSASAAGKASAAARREKADLRRQCQLWLETEIGKDKDGNPITGAQKMVQVAVHELAKGNPRFWELMRDTSGYKPVDRVMVSEVEPSVIAEVEELVKEASEE